MQVKGPGSAQARCILDPPQPSSLLTLHPLWESFPLRSHVFGSWAAPPNPAYTSSNTLFACAGERVHPHASEPPPTYSNLASTPTSGERLEPVWHQGSVSGVIGGNTPLSERRLNLC